MKSGVKVKFKRKNPKFWNEFTAHYKDIPQVAVGFPRGPATSAQYPDGTSVVDVAFWNNYGTKNQDGGDHIPARRFMDIAGKKSIQELSPILKKLIPRLNEGKMKFNDIGEIVGQKAVAIFKREITELSEPPNAPATIERKGSSNPLIDTGLMRQTVTFDIRDERK